MKTLMTSLIILCFSCVFILYSQAQTPQLTKGSLLIGTTTSLGGDFYDFEHLGGGNTAGLSFGSTWSSNGSTSEKDKYTSYNLTPRVGYFFMDGLAGGLNINIRGQSNKGDGDDKDKISTTTFGPWIRYYAMQWALLGGKIIPFAEGKAAWGSSKETYTSGSSSNTYKWGASEYAIGPGLALFITDNICMDMMIGYRKATWKDKDATETTKYHDSTFGFAFGLTVLIPPCW